MTRDQAIQALEKPALSEDEARIEFDYVCNKMEIDRSELESYFTKPKKTYKDFKSQQFFYEFGSKVMKRLGLERGWKKVIVIIDYGLGNIKAFSNILQRKILILELQKMKKI